ncbi:MAG TPA: hypothetical protein VGJ09_13215 [Bryobacteraceae bacterium]
MQSRLGGWLIVAAAGAAFSLLSVMPSPAQAPAYKAPKTKDGKADLNGIWQSINEANWDIRPHAAAQGPVFTLGAAYSQPAGLGVVEGGDIPYKPEAAAKQKENFANRLKLDPEIKCYMAGVPRANYMPYPFQIVQGTNTMMMVYEYAGAVRVVNMAAPTKAPADSWMGWSNGHWEGDSLVVDVTSLNDQTWFDRAGDWHSDQLHVVERYTRVGPDTLQYEATIDDPKVFTRPWKMSMPLYRRVEKNAQLLEYKCVEFAEEVLYGHLRKQPVQGKGDSK